MKKESMPSEKDIHQLLSGGILSADYPRGIELLGRRNGLSEAYRRLGDDRRRFDFKGTIAAVDSELALLCESAKFFDIPVIHKTGIG